MFDGRCEAGGTGVSIERSFLPREGAGRPADRFVGGTVVPGRRTNPRQFVAAPIIVRLENGVEGTRLNG